MKIIMRLGNTFLIYTVIITILLSNSTYSVSINRNTDMNCVASPSISITDETIYISNDDELANVATSGNGTKVNPFVIENLTITNATDYAVRITNITKYVLIKNCNFSDNPLWVLLIDTKTYGSVIVFNNTFTNNVVDIEAAIGCNITHNKFTGTVRSSRYFANFWYLSHTVISNNVFYNYDDIYFDGDSNVFTQNKFINIGCIQFFRVSDVLFRNNSLLNSSVCLSSNNNISIIYNNFSDCGLLTSDSSTTEIKGNIVNSYPLGYFVNETDLLIYERYGQLILINCNFTTIKNQVLMNTPIAIKLLNCRECQFTNNTIFNNVRGLYMYGVSNSLILNNTFMKNYIGLNLNGGGKNNITSNTFTTNEKGLFLKNSSYNLIDSNNLSNKNLIGLDLLNADNNEITYNNFSYNQDAINIFNCRKSKIKNNTFISNIKGISLEYAVSFLIIENHFLNNVRFGIKILSGSENILYHNWFSGKDTLDYGNNNTWYSKELKEGNIWLSWTGTGNYSITGTAGSIDLYPAKNGSYFFGSTSSMKNSLPHTTDQVFGFRIIPLIATIIISTIAKKRIKIVS